MNSRWYRLIALGAAAAVAVTVTALLLRSKYSSSQTPAVAAVRVATVSVASGDVPIEQDTLGQVMALNTVTIRPQVGGQVTAIQFKDGQFVKEGDVLVQIDPRPLQATVDQDKATLLRDRANLSSAQTDLGRYLPLLKEGIVSAQQVSDQRALVGQRQATVAADQAALEGQQIQLGYTTITAPLAGILGLRMIDVGNTLNPANPAGIVVLTQIQPITVVFPVPQASLTEIQERQTASKTGLVVQAWSQDGSRELDKGVLSALSNEVDATTGTVMLKAVFPNPNQLLWPGSSVAVRLVLDVQHDGLTVPAAAVSQGPDGPYAWTVGADGTAAISPLKIRQQLRGLVLVSSGLRAGEQVVTDGQYGLTRGAHVSVEAPSKLASAEAAGAPALRTNQTDQLGISP
jgi:membrane fusion protein, multidrug efflux system